MMGRRISVTDLDKTIFYSDEINDDFGKKHVRYDPYKGKKKIVVERRGFYEHVSNFFFAIIYFLVKTFSIIVGVKWIGKENVKKLDNKKGYFIYANHAGELDVALAYLISHKQRTNTIGYSEAIANPATKLIVPICGFIPLPVDIHDIPKMTHAISYYIQEKKQVIVIYPEAHLWPNYTGVRNFKRQSFRYPIELDAPVLPVFFARRKRKGFWKVFKKPRVTVIIGEPLYPDKDLNRRDAIQKLGDDTYESLVKLSKTIEQEDYWHYVYRPKNEENID